MNIPSALRYTKTHEWARQEGEEIIVGITAHAQEELRDIVFVELPKVGRAVKGGEAAAVIESVKAAFDIYAPVSGVIARVNETLSASPQAVNQDCYGAGWLFAVRPQDAGAWARLLSADDYTKQLGTPTH